MSLAASRKLENDILLVHLPKEPNEKWIAAIEAKHPGLRVRWVTRIFQNSEQRQGELPLPAEAFEGATMLCTSLPQPANLIANVRFVQLTSAGADRWITHEKYRDPAAVFCTTNGIHSPQIAEWVIGTWLMMSHHFLYYAQNQAEGKWRRYPSEVQDAPGMRMGILGYGAIGRQCGRLASALGMEVYAYTRSERSTAASRRDDETYSLPGMGDPEGVIPARWFHGGSREDIDNFLAQDLDILVISLPLTGATRHIIGRAQFDILARKRTFLANIGRGPHVDTDALIEALRDDKIRGAALDVTDPEPLPEGHPLFSAPNVFVTPHVSWSTPCYYERVLDVLEANLERLSKGEPLLNVMNKEHHY